MLWMMRSFFRFLLRKVTALSCRGQAEEEGQLSHCSNRICRLSAVLSGIFISTAAARFSMSSELAFSRWSTSLYPSSRRASSYLPGSLAVFDNQACSCDDFDQIICDGERK